VEIALKRESVLKEKIEWHCAIVYWPDTGYIKTILFKATKDRHKYFMDEKENNNIHEFSTFKQFLQNNSRREGFMENNNMEVPWWFFESKMNDRDVSSTLLSMRLGEENQDLCYTFLTNGKRITCQGSLTYRMAVS